MSEGGILYLIWKQMFGKDWSKISLYAVMLSFTWFIQTVTVNQFRWSGFYQMPFPNRRYLCSFSPTSDLRNQPYRRADGGRRSAKWKQGQQLQVSSDISLWKTLQTRLKTSTSQACWGMQREVKHYSTDTVPSKPYMNIFHTVTLSHLCE